MADATPGALTITKYVHSCLLVESPDSVALFDPGVMSEAALDVNRLRRLDDIFITHEHSDHLSVPLVKLLVSRFPGVRITAPVSVAAELTKEGLSAGNTPPDTAKLFDSPHENVSPMISVQPQEIGVHYLDTLSHPGDSHSFNETMPILALPVTAPWGSAVDAMQLALRLKPKHVLPIHDWHWRDEARLWLYDSLERILGEAGIKFYKLETGVPVEVSL